jgi:hypothetical protein
MHMSQFNPNATLHDGVLTLEGTTRAGQGVLTLSVEIAASQNEAVVQARAVLKDNTWTTKLQAAEFEAGSIVASGLAVSFRPDVPAFETFAWSQAVEVTEKP